MNTQIFLRIAFVLGLMIGGIAKAEVNLGLVTVNQTVNSVDVALVVTGLSELSAPALSTYDLDIRFDPNHLTLSGVQFGDPVLGSQLDVFDSGDNVTEFELNGVGSVNLFEFTLDTPEDLNNWQTDHFTLATLSFRVLNPVSSRLDINVNVFDDADALPISVVTGSATVTSVPLPASVWMMGITLGLLFRNRRGISLICKCN